jgi:hypothetical protein
MRQLSQLALGQNQYIYNIGSLNTELFQLENVVLFNIEL